MITRILVLAILLAGPNLLLAGSKVSISALQTNPLLVIKDPGATWLKTPNAAAKQYVLDVPVQLVLTTSETAIAPGSQVNVNATINARGALAGVELILSTEEPITLSGPLHLYTT